MPVNADFTVPQPFGEDALMISRLLPPLLLLIFIVATGRASESPARPNILFIIADDLGWADVGFNGSEIKTPNLDRLAADGVRLDQHYVYPTCSPTRVALLSGRFPSRFGVFTPLGATTKMTGRDACLPQELKRLGYRTHLTGKWHIGETPEHRPRGYGFDTTYGYLRGQIDPYTHRYKTGDHVSWHRNDEFFDEEGHVTDLITDEAIRVVRESGDAPFFLYVAHHSPHYPLNEPPKWFVPYEETIADPSRRHFAAAVSHLDDAIGRLLAALDASGKGDNTVVIFSSDNGGQEHALETGKVYNGRYAPLPHLGKNAPLRGWKTDLYEGGIRVPALVRWPGVISAGGVVETPVHICDWAPTLIGLAGGKIDSNWKPDGLDIAPLLKSDATRLERRVLYWRTNRGIAVREGDWKLIIDAKGDKPELFDLASDPNESNDLAAKHPEKVVLLRGELDRIRTGDDPE